MRELVSAEGPYAARCAALIDSGIALWDVLRHSLRPGSLDADIRLDTAQANDFKSFFREHGHIEAVVFNGRKAEQLFRRFVQREMPEVQPRLVRLPSTSPAFAAMPFNEKLARWRATISH